MHLPATCDHSNVYVPVRTQKYSLVRALCDTNGNGDESAPDPWVRWIVLRRKSGMQQQQQQQKLQTTIHWTSGGGRKTKRTREEASIGFQVESTPYVHSYIPGTGVGSDTWYVRVGPSALLLHCHDMIVPATNHDNNLWVL